MRKINKLIPLPNFNGSNYYNDCTLWCCKNCNQITFHDKFKDNNYKIQREAYSEIYNPIVEDISFKYDQWGVIIEKDGKIKKTVEVLKRRRANSITTIQALRSDGKDIEDIKSSLLFASFSSVQEQEL